MTGLQFKSLWSKYIKTIWFSCFLLLFASISQTPVYAQSLPKPKEGYSYYCIGDPNHDWYYSRAAMLILELPANDVRKRGQHNPLCQTDSVDAEFIREWFKPGKGRHIPGISHETERYQKFWSQSHQWRYTRLPKLTRSSFIMDLDLEIEGQNLELSIIGGSVIGDEFRYDSSDPQGQDKVSWLPAFMLGFNHRNSSTYFLSRLKTREFAEIGAAYLGEPCNQYFSYTISGQNENCYAVTIKNPGFGRESLLHDEEHSKKEYLQYERPISFRFDSPPFRIAIEAVANVGTEDEVVFLCKTGTTECALIFHYNNWRFIAFNLTRKDLADWKAIIAGISGFLDDHLVLDFNVKRCAGVFCPQMYKAGFHKRWKNKD